MAECFFQLKKKLLVILVLFLLKIPSRAQNCYFSSVGTGETFAVGLALSGEVFTWGTNDLGFGISGLSSSETPVQVTGIPLVNFISVGWYHSVVIGQDGNLYSWGWNPDGELGNGRTIGSDIPVTVVMTPFTGKNVTFLASGYSHTVALTSDFSVFAWGANTTGQLSVGPHALSGSLIPVDITSNFGGEILVSAAAGDGFTVALTTNGNLVAWGDNTNGALGIGKPISVDTIPTPFILKSVNFTLISAFSFHVMALSSDGSIYTWGDNVYGQLGIGTTANANAPVKVILPSNDTIVSITTGSEDSLVMTSGGIIFTWGLNTNGKLCVGSLTPTESEIPIETKNEFIGKTILEISSGDYFVSAISEEGYLLLWGLYKGVANVIPISIPCYMPPPPVSISSLHFISCHPPPCAAQRTNSYIDINQQSIQFTDSGFVEDSFNISDSNITFSSLENIEVIFSNNLVINSSVLKMDFNQSDNPVMVVKGCFAISYSTIEIIWNSTEGRFSLNSVISTSNCVILNETIVVLIGPCQTQQFLVTSVIDAFTVSCDKKPNVGVVIIVIPIFLCIMICVALTLICCCLPGARRKRKDKKQPTKNTNQSTDTNPNSPNSNPSPIPSSTSNPSPDSTHSSKPTNKT